MADARRLRGARARPRRAADAHDRRGDGGGGARILRPRPHRRDRGPRQLHRRARRRGGGARAWRWHRACPSSAPPALPSWRIRPTSCSGRPAAGRLLAVAVDARRGMRLPPALRGRARREPGAPLLLAPEDAARQIGTRPVIVVGSGAGVVADAVSGRRRPGRSGARRPAAACALAGAAGRRSRARPRPCGRSICGRPTSSRRPTTPCRELHPMTGAIDYSHVSILWASPEHAAELAAAARRPVREALGRRSFSRLLSHPGSTAFLARVGTPPQTVGLHPGPARRRRGGDPHPRRAQGQPAPRHRPPAGRGAGPRRQEGRGAAAVSRGRAGQCRRRSASTRGSASRRSGGARATTSTPARRPRMR